MIAKKFIFPALILLSGLLPFAGGGISASAQVAAHSFVQKSSGQAVSSSTVYSSTKTSSPAKDHAVAQKIDWDNDIRSIRLNDIPSFSYSYDDYIQFSPAAALIVMRACGVEGRSKAGAEWLSAEAFSAGIMALAVNGIKYSVKRLRPDGSTKNSFPSGHTATAFMCATMLHKEYGWRSPWISFAGYSIASITGASRIMNHRHWCTDILAGAVIGVGSVELGYLINDAIFKKKNISDAWEPLKFDEDKSLSYWSLEYLYGHRYGIGSRGRLSGGVAAIQADIPVHPRVSTRIRLGINSLRDRNTDSYSAHELGLTSNFYDYLAGAVFNWPFAKILYAEGGALIGGGYRSLRCPEAMRSEISKGYGEFLCGGSFGIRIGCNFRVKLHAEYNLMLPLNHSILLAFGSSFFW